MPVSGCLTDLSAGNEGEARIREVCGEIELAAGSYHRVAPGWYIEVFRDGSWHRELGPYWLPLNGDASKMIEDAKARGIL